MDQGRLPRRQLRLNPPPTLRPAASVLPVSLITGEVTHAYGLGDPD